MKRVQRKRVQQLQVGKDLPSRGTVEVSVFGGCDSNPANVKKNPNPNPNPNPYDAYKGPLTR